MHYTCTSTWMKKVLLPCRRQGVTVEVNLRNLLDADDGVVLDF